MNKKIIFVSIAIVLALAVVYSIGYNAGKKSVSFGGSTDDDWNVGGDLNITGDTAFTGTLTVTGESNLDTLVQGGDVTTMATTTGDADLQVAPTAAEICDSAIIKISLAAEGGTDTTENVQLPTSTDLIADCMPAAGDSKKVKFWNYSTSTLTLTFTQRAIASTTLDFNLSSSTDPITQPTTATLSEDEFMWVFFQNIDGTTTTVDFFPLDGL